MLAAGIKSPVPLEELEIHLREEIELQMKLGEREVQAFKTAAQRIGHAHMIQKEFKKTEAAGWHMGQIWAGAIVGLLQSILIGAVLFNSEMIFGDRMSSLAAIATSFLFMAVMRSFYKILPVIPTKRKRTAAVLIFGGVPAFMWCGVVAGFVLPGHEFPFGQWLATVLWVVAPPLGAFLGLIWGIEIAARKDVVIAD